MLNAAKARLKQNDSSHYFLGAFQDKLTTQYPLICCQAALEWLENPDKGIQIHTKHLEPEGYLFLVFYSKDLSTLRYLIRGNLNAALSSGGCNVNGPTPINPLKISDVFSTLDKCVMKIKRWFGVHTFIDLQQPETQERLGEDTLLEFEQALCDQDPYRSIARHVGVIAKKVSK